MSKCNNLEFVRFIDIDCQTAASNIQALMNCKGMNENAIEIPIAQAITGKIALTQCSEEMEVEFKEAFPYVEFTVLEYVKYFTVKFVDGNGNVLYTQKVLQDGEAKYIGETPTKKSTVQFDYTFEGWDRPLKPILSDTTIYATFNSVLRYYTIRFINSDTQEVISSQYLAFGSTPTAPAFPEGANTWTPSISVVLGDQDYYTEYVIYPEDLSIFNFSTVTINGVSGYSVSLKTNTTMPSYVIYPYIYNDKPVLEITGSSSYNSTYQSVITEIYIPETVVKIGDYAFNRFGIKQIDLPKVTSLGNSCFRDCSSLTTISIPKATSLGNYCFYSCSSLTTIDIPLVTSLGDYCFEYCRKLTTIDIPLVTSLGNSCFSSCSSLATISIPKVTSLEEYCFYYCKSLTTIDIPLVTSLGDYCFNGCSSLITIDLPLVTSLGSNCFKDCSKLTLFTLGEVSSPITNTSNFSTSSLNTYITTLNIYVENASNPPTLTGSPWGATNATIYYKQA